MCAASKIRPRPWATGSRPAQHTLEPLVSVLWAEGARKDSHMTDASDCRPIVAVIEAAIKLARRNPKPDEPIPTDEYLAFVIYQELRRQGLRIVPR